MRRFSSFLCLIFTLVMVAPPSLRSSLAKPRTEPVRTMVPFDFAKINPEMTKEFEKAWRIAKAGTSEYEGVVLFYLLPDGSYRVEALKSTNEFKKFTFTWDDRIVAIFHTHPKSVDPRPSTEDTKVADKYNVLMFTLTTRGMYVYDPGSKKTAVVVYGLDWLKASNWTDELALRMANLSPSFASRLVVTGSR
jgi:proteasome lid subunit RPN8/RPN11